MRKLFVALAVSLFAVIANAGNWDSSVPSSGDTIYPATATVAFPYGFAASTGAISETLDVGVPGSQDGLVRVYTSVDADRNTQIGGGSAVFVSNIGQTTSVSYDEIYLQDEYSVETITISGTRGDIDVSGEISANTFVGDGSGLTGLSSGPVFSSSETVGTTDIASTSDVGIATATITCRGGRPLKFSACITISNNSGSAKTYTITLSKDGVPIHEHLMTEGGVGSSLPASPFSFEASSDSGEHNYSLWIRSTSAVGTQTVDDVHLLVEEW